MAIRFTVNKFPLDPESRDATGLPWGCVVQPFALDDEAGIPGSGVAASVGTGGSSIRKSSSNSSIPRFGSSSSLNSASGGTALQPLPAALSPAPLPLADDVARCEDCYAYINRYCAIDRFSWRCSLCDVVNPFSDAELRRYGGSNVADVAELSHTLVELDVAAEGDADEVEFEQGESQGDGEVAGSTPHGLGEPISSCHVLDEAEIRKRPVYIAMVDVSGSEEFLELVKSSLLAALEALSPAALFGLVTFGSKVGLYDLQGPVAAVKSVAIPASSAHRLPLALGDLLPLPAFLASLSRHKEHAAAALETLRPDPPPLDLDASASLPLFSPPLNPSPPLLTTPPPLPALGDLLPLPAFLASLSRHKEHAAAALETLRPDPPPLDLDASGGGKGGGGKGGAAQGAGGKGGGGKGGKDAERGGRKDGVRGFGTALDALIRYLGGMEDGPSARIARGLRADVINTSGSGGGGGGNVSIAAAAAAAAAAGEVGPFVGARLLVFLSGAPNHGMGALSTVRYDTALASLAVAASQRSRSAKDVADPVVADKGLLQEQTPFYRELAAAAVQAGVCVDLVESGGTLFLYPSLDEATLPQDIYRMLCRPSAFGGVLRLRTSRELRAVRAYGHFFPDAQYENLYHIIRCDPFDSYAFDLEFAGKAGFGVKGRSGREKGGSGGGNRGAVLQLAFQYTVIIPVEGGGERGEGGGTGNGAASNGDGAATEGAREIYESADNEAIVTVLTHKVIRASLEEGVREGRLLLQDWLVILTAHYNHAFSSTSFLSLFPLGTPQVIRASLEEGVREGRLLLQDWLVILTAHYNHAFSSTSFLSLFPLGTPQVIRASLEEGAREGRLLLQDWLVILTAHYNHAFGLAQFNQPHSVTRLDVSFSACPQLQPLPRLAFALLRSPLLQLPREGVHPDLRTFLHCLYSSLLRSPLLQLPREGVHPDLCTFLHCLYSSLLCSPLLQLSREGVHPDLRTFLHCLYSCLQNSPAVAAKFPGPFIPHADSLTSPLLLHHSAPHSLTNLYLVLSISTALHPSVDIPTPFVAMFPGPFLPHAGSLPRPLLLHSSPPLLPPPLPTTLFPMSTALHPSVDISTPPHRSSLDPSFLMRAVYPVLSSYTTPDRPFSTTLYLILFHLYRSAPLCFSPHRSSLDPSFLMRAVYPVLSSYTTPDRPAFPRHSLSRAALVTSGSPIFLLDAFSTIVVFYSPAAPPDLPFPPPQTTFPRHSLSRAALVTSGSPIFLLDAFSTVIVFYSPAAPADETCPSHRLKRREPHLPARRPGTLALHASSPAALMRHQQHSCVTSGSPIFLLAAFSTIIVFYSPAAPPDLPFPPPQTSKLTFGSVGRWLLASLRHQRQPHLPASRPGTLALHASSPAALIRHSTHASPAALMRHQQHSCVTSSTHASPAALMRHQREPHLPACRIQHAPPVTSGLLRTTINRLKADRIITPRTITIRGGVDSTAPFETFLIEEQDVDGDVEGGAVGMGFVAFLESIARDVREYMK
ncbi:unnamed protein product [Closterium sp. Naga37s-1]|nr:unnamed protein product [Closterium sp. Naga37s-1]